MRLRARVVTALPVVAVLLTTAACSSSVTGSGTGSIAASSTSSTPTPTAPSSTPRTSSSAPTAKTSASAPTSKSSSSAPLGPATLISVTFTSPACGSSIDPKNFTLKWTSKNGTEVWIESGPTAAGLVGVDPRTDGNGQKLTNPDNGSVDAQYDCKNDNYYYLIEIYNTSNTTSSGQVTQVPKG